MLKGSSRYGIDGERRNAGDAPGFSEIALITGSVPEGEGANEEERAVERGTAEADKVRRAGVGDDARADSAWPRSDILDIDSPRREFCVVMVAVVAVKVELF